jgi:hypothetical protein
MVRLANVERRLEKLYDLEPAVLAHSVRDLHEDVQDLRDEMRSLRRAVVGSAITVAVSAVGFAFVVMQTWGTP